MEEKTTRFKNYVYHVRILNLPEDVFWAQARSMNNLRNAMIRLRADFLDQSKPLYEKEISKETVAYFRSTVKDFYENIEEKKRSRVLGKNSAAAAPSTAELDLSQIKKLRWKMFDAGLIKLTRSEEWKKQLGWEAREAVLERFKMSLRGNNNKKDISPKPASDRVNEISFYHRFSKGGFDTEKIFTKASKKISLEPVPVKFYADNGHQNRKSRYSEGIFGIGIEDTSLKISVYLHRPIPEGKLKTVQFIGKFSDITRAWTWKIVFAVQTGKLPETPKYKPVAALDLNWRRLGDYLRIGFIKDTAGNAYELKLPLIEKPNRRAFNTLKNVNRARQKDGLKPIEMIELFPQNIFELNDWRRQTDVLKDKLKNEIKTIFSEQSENAETPAHITNFLQHFDRIGRRGLLKLKRVIGELDDNVRSGVDSEVFNKLEAYENADRKKRLAIHRTEAHLKNKRKKLYENLALWLKTNYSRLIWEGDLSLKKMGERAPRISIDSDQAGIKIGNKFRQYAGLYFLRRKIKEQNQCENDWLINIKSKDTTRLCHLCGELMETTTLFISCENGHTFDQDDNSSSNLLRAGLVENSDLNYSRKKEKLFIPQHLENYIIPVIDTG